jgi:hypothetical protein
MKKYGNRQKTKINTLGTLLLASISVLYPVQNLHSSPMCCVNCAMKKEEEIEVVVDEVENTEA